MEARQGISVRNWKGSIVSHPAVVVNPESPDEIAEILKDSNRYPAPVRAVGSNHSTTRCAVAEGGTVIDMTRMNRILSIEGDRVTAEAGALRFDVAKELERHGAQFHVNVELGNLTMGSACSGGTKDASMPGEFGQVNSYAIAIKMVLPNGERMEVTEDDPELLRVVRSSYGLLGVIYEVTFRIKPLQPIAVDHVSYKLDDFLQQLPSLLEREASMMYFMAPFLDRIIVEFRSDSADSVVRNRSVWRFRNWAWKSLAPGFGYLMTRYVPWKNVRYAIIDGFNFGMQLIMNLFVDARATSPADQIILYPHDSDWRAYTFSIWAFREEEFPEHIRAYYRFCHAYYERTGFRCDLLNVGYRIAQDTSSLFSYTAEGNMMTLDPVASGQEGWDDFITAYNEFCSERGGKPLFNQTKGLLPEQAKRAFPTEFARFADFRKQYDPEDRLLNDYFREMLH